MIQSCQGKYDELRLMPTSLGHKSCSHLLKAREPSTSRDHGESHRGCREGRSGSVTGKASGVLRDHPPMEQLSSPDLIYPSAITSLSLSLLTAVADHAHSHSCPCRDRSSPPSPAPLSKALRPAHPDRPRRERPRHPPTECDRIGSCCHLLRAFEPAGG
jgi:hypothetical protein